MEYNNLSTHFEQFGPEKYQSLLVKLVGEMRRNKRLIQQMRLTPRFERYFKKGKEENRTRNKDAEELGHAINTYNIALELIQMNQQLDKTAAARMKLAALIHDLGELEDGDVSYDEKQMSDEEKEKRSFEKNLRVYFPGLSLAELDLLKKVYFEIALVKDKTNGAARYFNLIECLGYVNTALQEFADQPDEIDWQWLCANVMHNQGGKILSFVRETPVARAYLSKKKVSLGSMVDWAEEHIDLIKDFNLEDLKVWKEILSKV